MNTPPKGTASPPPGENQFYQSVFDATLESLWVLAPDGKVRSANRAALMVAGNSADDVVGQEFPDTAWWAGSDATRESVRQAVAESHAGLARREIAMYSHTGKEIWTDLSIKPVHNDDGTLNFLIAEGRDITERREALERLRQREILLAQSQSLGKMGNWTYDMASQTMTWSEGLYRLYGFTDDAPPQTIEEFVPCIHPEDREIGAPKLQAALETDIPQEYYTRVNFPDGQERVVRVLASRETNEAGEVLRVYGMVQDVTDARAAEQALTTSLKRLAMISEMAQTVTSTMDPELVKRQVVTSLRPIIGATAVVLFEHEEQKMVIRAADSDNDNRFIGVGIEDSGTVAGRGWLQGESLLLEGEEAAEQIHPRVQAALGYAPRAVISVPIRWQDQRLGVLQTFHPEEKAFTAADRTHLEIAAVWLAIALTNAQLWEQHRTARRIAEYQRERMRMLTRRVLSVQEDERKRIARELHDEAGQALAVLKMNLSLLRKEIKDVPLQERMQEIIDLTGQTAKNVRLLAHNLRPPALESFGLTNSLDDLCRRFASMTQIPVEFHADELVPLPDDFNIVCYRFVQEALANITKHANATEVRVSLTLRDSTLVIEIRDNGKGFDVEQARSGIGILGMTERLELLDGTLSIESEPGKGTCLTAHVPLERLETTH